MNANTLTEEPEIMAEKPVLARKVLLRVVFWALGLAAAFGAAGVIFAGRETLWRVVAPVRLPLQGHS